MNGSDPFETFCTAVCAKVRWPFARWNITQELTDHLRDHAAALEEKGLSPEEAQSQAVAAMGDPAELGRALNRVHSPLWGLTFVLLRLLILCLAFTVLQNGFLRFGHPRLISRFYEPVHTIQHQLDRGAQLIAQIPLDQWRQVDTLRIHYTNAYLVYHEPTGTHPPYWLYLEGALWQEDPFHQVGDLSYTSSYQPPSPITFSDNLGNQYDFSGEWYVGCLDPQASEVYLDYDQFGRHYRLTIPLDWGDAP